MTLHIAYSSDNNYARHVGASMISLFDNNRDFKQIVIHVLDNGIDKENKRKLDIIARDYNRQIKYYDFTNIKERLTTDVPDTIAISSYSRLFLSSTLSGDIDKVIYLDCDSIVLGSFYELWSEDIDDFYVAGVLDRSTPNTKKEVGLNIDAPYINAGFLLINLKKWRNENIEGRFIKFILKHNGNVYHHDQGVINGVFANYIKVLEPQFNVMTTFFEMSVDRLKQLYNVTPYYSQEQIDKAIEEPIFIHFTAAFSNRPWVESSRHPLKDRYLHYLNMTGWRGISLESDKRSLKSKLAEWMFYNLPFSFFYFIWKRS